MKEADDEFNQNNHVVGDFGGWPWKSEICDSRDFCSCRVAAIEFNFLPRFSTMNFVF